MPILAQISTVRSWSANTFWHCLTIDGFVVNHGRRWSSRGGCAREAWTTLKTDLNVNLMQISVVINSVQVFRWTFFTFVDRVRSWLLGGLSMTANKILMQCFALTWKAWHGHGSDDSDCLSTPAIGSSLCPVSWKALPPGSETLTLETRKRCLFRKRMPHIQQEILDVCVSLGCALYCIRYILIIHDIYIYNILLWLLCSNRYMYTIIYINTHLHNILYTYECGVWLWLVYWVIYILYHFVWFYMSRWNTCSVSQCFSWFTVRENHRPGSLSTNLFGVPWHRWMKLLITIGTCLVRTQRTCVEMFSLECLQGLLALEKCQAMMVSKMMELDTCGLCLADSQLMTRAETISASRGTARECRLPGCKILEETCEVSKTSWQSETQHVHQHFARHFG